MLVSNAVLRAVSVGLIAIACSEARNTRAQDDTVTPREEELRRLTQEGALSKAAIRADRKSLCRLRARVPVTVRHGDKTVKTEEIAECVISFPVDEAQEYLIVRKE